jgi:hypothetical protein
LRVSGSHYSASVTSSGPCALARSSFTRTKGWRLPRGPGLHVSTGCTAPGRRVARVDNPWDALARGQLPPDDRASGTSRPGSAKSPVETGSGGVSQGDQGAGLGDAHAGIRRCRRCACEGHMATDSLIEIRIGAPGSVLAVKVGRAWICQGRWVISGALRSL